ncbi:metallophosphatase domain-containing protein [bacterium]|nr:metallophosphatase domain-containing protein [bacterium]
MRIVCISDTHNRHPTLTLPEGDVLIHAGDFTEDGTVSEITQFLKWFGNQSHRHKILIAGNHELCLDDRLYTERWNRFHKKKENKNEVTLMIDSRFHYLENSSIDIDGIKFYGSPYSADMGWVFQYDGIDQAETIWKLIPDDTDVLITHTPTHGQLDVWHGRAVGCKVLSTHIERVKPRYHICGHIHDSHGISKTRDTTHINASIVNDAHVVTYDPIVFDL